MRTTSISIALVVGLAVPAAAEVQIVGHLVDNHGRDVESATVTIAGQQVLSNAHGLYRVVLPEPGVYPVVIDYADAHHEAKVEVTDAIATHDARLAIDSESVIVIHDYRAVATMPRSTTDPLREKAPPYSDHAIVSNRWAKAWLLLDIDDRGNVNRLKLLNDPGYELAPIAIREGFKQHFTPALDGAGKPMSTMMLYPVEWPSYWWLVQRHGTSLHIPRDTRYMECRGHGPLTMDSVEAEYRDCTDPDLHKAVTEPWIKRP